jgi:hypothetical protein
MQLLRARRRLFLALAVSLLVVAAPVAVIAANQNFNGNTERQSANGRRTAERSPGLPGRTFRDSA